jgi:hypothetical protein
MHVQSVNYLGTSSVDFCFSKMSSSSGLTRSLPAILDASCIEEFVTEVRCSSYRVEERLISRTLCTSRYVPIVSRGGARILSCVMVVVRLHTAMKALGCNCVQHYIFSVPFYVNRKTLNPVKPLLLPRDPRLHKYQKYVRNG